jgi:peptidase S51-like protein
MSSDINTAAAATSTMAQQPRGIGDLSMLRRARRDLRDAEHVALAVAEPCGPLAGALLSSLPETVWVGVSAGSMVMTPRIGDDFVEWPSAPDDRTLGVVDFSIFPHLGHELIPENTMAAAERWAADIAGPAYAIDDQTAIKVTDGTVEVVSEGHWTLFPA